MPVRRAAPPPPPPPKRTRSQDEEPARDALLAVLAERDRELAEAREQQAAVAEVLQAINASSGDLAAVFDSILEKAVRFCDATGGGLWLVEGDMARVVGGSHSTLPRSFLDYVFRAPLPVIDVLGRTGHGRPFIHIDDLRATRAYQERAPYVVACVELGDMRTALLAPLRENGAVVGIFTLIRNHVRPFTDKQIALVQAFAVQALIVIKNARLFNETRQALERQTATAEILRVISQSLTDARPVFERIVLTAARVLKCDLAAALLRDGDTFSPAASANAQGLLTDFVPALRVPIDPNANFPSRAILGKTMLHLPDWSLIDVPPHERVIQNLLGANSAIYLPLLREDECIGVLALVGTRPNSFGPKEIAQAESFRDQALIAIENARLFRETQEALEQQKASAEVLGAISKSVADTAPVFETILDACQRLFGSEEIGIYTIGDDEMVRAAAWRGPRAEEARHDVTPLAESVTGRVIRERRTHHIPDLGAVPNLAPTLRDRVNRHGGASLLYAPMLWEDSGLGSIVVVRWPPRPFSEREQALLQSFANQAAIAIQNARLFNETKEALERQTATSEILRAIAGSPSDAQPVFESIVVSAVKRLQCDLAFVMLSDQRVFMPVAGANPEGLLSDLGPRQAPIDWDANFPSRALLSKETYYLPDWSDVELPPHERAIHELLGLSSAIYMPLLRDGEARGLLTLARNRPSSFSASDIAQAEAFRDQAIIALENARLFNETKEALERQTATANVLKVISQSVSDAAPVFETILESCQRLFGLEAVAVYLVEGGRVKGVAQRGWDGGDWGRDAQPLEGSSTGRAIAERRAVHYPDLLADRPDIPEDKKIPLRERGGMSVLYAPMLSEDRGVGSIVVSRTPVRPFSDKEISLVQSFADQAAIAIQNTRLFNETQEALEQQKASGDVLRAIAQSVADATPVFENILDASQRLFGTEEVCIFLVSEDGMVRPTGVRGPLFLAARNDVMPLEGSRTGRVIRERRVHHIPDGLADPDTPPAVLERMRRGGNVSIAFAPMLWEDSGLGSIAILRSPPRPFSERELELLRGFADQAVIAIKNARLFDEVQARTRDLEEALAQQTATADVLKVISRSVLDLDSVLQTLIDTAVRLAHGNRGTIFIQKGDVLVASAFHSNVNPALREYLATTTWRLDGDTQPARAAREGRVVHVPDLAKLEDETTQEVRKRAAFGAGLWVPLIGERQTIGVFGVPRDEPVAFTDREIEIVKTFADQAVIAIENARLFEEVQARTRDLTEALQQQTATADVLKVISRSAFDLNLATTAILETAAKLCRAPLATLHLRDGDACRLDTQFGLPEAFLREARETPIPVRYPLHSRRAARAGDVAHFTDAWTDPDYLYKASARLGGYRAIIVVPLMRDDELVGIFSLGRPEPEPFTESQIKLVQSFADQAAIAVENSRLFNEVKARTDDLAEALQQQTATADVLKVISRSAFDLQAVLDALTSSAVELSGAVNGTICLRQGDGYRYRATSGMQNEFAKFLAEHPPTAGRATMAGRVILSGKVECVPDLLEDPDYATPTYALNQTRSLLGVPLLRNDKVEGALMLGRTEPGEFAPRIIELVQTFADQALIAVENVRLFDEVQARTRDLTEALQMQTATSDVLKVISRSAFDLQAVFNTLVSSAVELGGALTGTICVRDGDVFRYRDTIGAEHTSALAQYLRDHPATPGRSTIAGRVLLSGEVERIPDCLADPEYVVPMGSLASNVRSLLGVPLLRKEGVEGAIILTRDEPGHFSDRQVEIVQTFADQAVIALENVRLFEEVQARTKELAQSLDDLRKAQDRLIQSEKLASLGQLTAGIAHEIKNPLNFVNNFSALSRELMDELRAILEKAPLEEADREEAGELIGMIDANLDKVVSHGKRADSIVKNMLLHSREGSGERTSVNVNAMVEEALNLAYHGARAEKPGFNVNIAKSLDPKAGTAELYAQEITRVLLNLISNGFYATTKRKQAEANGGYEPTITASTRDLGHSVEIAIRDNGTGIPDEVKAKMFNPFFTTKPAGEGTGLGLSLSHDIVAKQHGGTIEVATEPGAFTQFTLVLPREGAEK